MCRACDTSGGIFDGENEGGALQDVLDSSAPNPPLQSNIFTEGAQENDFGDGAQTRSERARSARPEAAQRRKPRSVTGMTRPMRAIHPVLIPCHSLALQSDAAHRFCAQEQNLPGPLQSPGSSATRGRRTILR